MTTHQDLRSTDLAQLTALYEGGNCTQALKTIDALGLPSLLKEQPDARGHASLALLVAKIYREAALDSHDTETHGAISLPQRVFQVLEVRIDAVITMLFNETGDGQQLPCGCLRVLSAER
jgi:hypothetical protein